MAMSVTRPAGLAEHVPLSGLSTLGVGGPARYYVRCDSADSVARAAAWASENKLSLLILGGGRNLVVADDGSSGPVLHRLAGGRGPVQANGAGGITEGAGEPWDPLVDR